MGLNCFGISFSSPNITLDSDSTHQKLSKSDYHAIWKKWENAAIPGEGEQRDMAVEAMKIHLKNKMPPNSTSTILVYAHCPIFYLLVQN